jgi:hypothetical protein
MSAGFAILPDEQVDALAEARELRRHYEQLGQFPLVWVAREWHVREDGTRRLRYVVKTSGQQKGSRDERGSLPAGVGRALTTEKGCY